MNLSKVAATPIKEWLLANEGRMAAEWNAGKRKGEWGRFALAFKEAFGKWPVEKGGIKSEQ